MAETTVTMKELAQRAGLSYRTLAHWIEKGLIRPKGYVGRQRCTVPLTEKEAREVWMLAQLRKVLSMQALRKALKFLRSIGHNPMSTGSFAVVSGNPPTLVKICAGGEALEVTGRRPGQTMLIPLWSETVGDDAGGAKK